MSLAQKLKVALIQVGATPDKSANLKTIGKKVREAASQGAKLIVLPECFNSPYAVTAFPEYAEEVPSGETTKFLKDLAVETQSFLIGGSIPEKEGDKVFNTSLSFNPSGNLIAKHRKAHLFDIDIPGKISFKESETLTAGNKATVFELEGYGKIGLGICYDIRFPELAAVAARKGAFAMIYPGAFNTTTGPLHWHLLARGRAVDNQMYVIAASPARDLSAGYHAYGHSHVVDPWGKSVVEAGEGEETIYTELDPEVIQECRNGIPLINQRRFDIYPDVSTGSQVSDV